MKAISFAIFTLMVGALSLGVNAQNLTASTSEIHLDLKKGLVNTTNLPTIKWISPALEHTVSTVPAIQLDVEIRSAHALKDISLNIYDGVTKTLYGSKKLSGTGSQPVKVQEKLFLPGNSIRLELVVVNSDGVQVSGSRSILVGEDMIANAVLVDRKDYALIFATDKYDHWDDLVNPVSDAHAIASELKTKYGFETEVVENPSIEEVWEKIRSYNERKFKSQDQLFVFFAGHGHFDESFGEGYVVARNSLLKDNSRTTYISHNRLRGVVNNIPCQHILLMMDVCFGGTFDPVLARARGAADMEATSEELIVRKLSHKTRKYLTSGGKEYVSDGNPGSHSPFATKFLEALKTDGGTDRILTLAELQVSLEKLKQLPRYGSFGDDEPLGDFVFLRR